MNTPVISVGIDVGKKKLDVACMRSDRSVVHEIFNNNEVGIRSLKRFLKQQRTAPTVPCILESTGAYHLLVATMLTSTGVAVKCINPIITKKYMKASIRNAKSDKIDCARLAEIGFLEPSLPIFTDTKGQIAARGLLSALAQLETVRQKIAAHIAHLEEIQGTLGIRIAHRESKKALDALERQIAAHRAMICELAPKEAKILADNMPGVSHEQAAALLVGLSGKQFENRDQLVAFVGLDIRLRESGAWQGRRILSKRGNAYLRKLLFQIGWALKMHNPRYKDHYASMRARGKNFKTCIIAVARKFLRFLFAFYWKKSIAAFLPLPPFRIECGASRLADGRALAMAAR